MLFQQHYSSLISNDSKKLTFPIRWEKIIRMIFIKLLHNELLRIETREMAKLFDKVRLISKPTLISNLRP